MCLICDIQYRNSFTQAACHSLEVLALFVLGFLLPAFQCYYLEWWLLVTCYWITVKNVRHSYTLQSRDKITG